MTKRFYKISLYIFLSLSTTGCFQTVQTALPNYYPETTQTQYPVQPQPYSPQAYNIPPEYLPPLGKCRIWYPDRPPGHQPPPGNCKKLQKKVPLGATLIYPAAESQYPTQTYNIPPGHLPPPGECRIWYPDRPAGHQPPPGNCRKLQKQVPAGARLIRG